MVRSAGIDPATGREIFIKKNGELTYDFSYDDEVIVGNSRPTIEGVLGSSFSWKGLSVSADFRYRVGGYSFNSVLFNKVESISTGSLIYNQDKRALYDRWQKPGDRAQFKDIANSVSTPMSSRFVQRDNSWSLESLRVGYEFSPELARRFGHELHMPQRLHERHLPPHDHQAGEGNVVPIRPQRVVRTIINPLKTHQHETK